MKIKDIMTLGPAVCTPENNLQEAARMMLENDCGEIPVVENTKNLKPVGVITDRDIVCRAVAKGKDVLHIPVRDCMSHPCITIRPEASVEECCKILEKKQIRRIPVIDEKGACCGIVSQADIARHHLTKQIAEVLEFVSQPHKGVCLF